MGRNLTRRLLALSLFAMLLPAAAWPQQAAPWPSKPIRLIVPAAAGGPTDIVGRIVAAELSTSLGQQVWVENRVGAGHLIGMTAGAQAEPDGYTFLVVTTPYVVMPWLQKKMPYDMKDLQAVIWMTSSPFVLVVPPTLPVKSVQELVALAKAKPNDLNMASAGPTTGPHLTGELFRLAADIKVQHVAYRGGPQAETAILRGEATFLFDTPSGALRHIETGAMRGLAVTSLKRMENAPEIPTIAESGLPNFEADSWNGLVAPAGVPKTIVKRMEDAVATALAKPEIKKRLNEAGFTPVAAPLGGLRQSGRARSREVEPRRQGGRADRAVKAGADWPQQPGGHFQAFGYRSPRAPLYRHGECVAPREFIMKPASFDYHAPATVEEAVALLNAKGPDSRLLAGGQSLIPMMNFRVAAPAVIVDLNRIPDLAYIKAEGDAVCIGAMTRQRAIEFSPLVAEKLPLLNHAIKLVGHLPTRTRGTIGGSIANADPAAEIPMVLQALDGEVVVRGSDGRRIIAASKLFSDAMTTSLAPGEILIEVRLPAMPAGAGCAIEEFARRHGDFAIVAIAAVIRRSGEDCAQACIATAGISAHSKRLRGSESLLEQEGLGEIAIARAAEMAASEVEPLSDRHASAAYRRQLTLVLTERAIRRAASAAA